MMPIIQKKNFHEIIYLTDYDINCNFNLLVNVLSGLMLCKSISGPEIIFSYEYETHGYTNYFLT